MSDKPNPFAPHWLIRDIVVGSHIRAVGAGNLLLLGDSIVENFYWNRLGPFPAINAGYSGIRAGELLDRAPRLLDLAKPRLAAILVGTNDAKKEGTGGRTEAQLEAVANHCAALVRLSRETGVPFVVMTPPPVERGKRLTRFYSVEAMASLSRCIAHLAESHGAGLVDLHGAFAGADGAARAGTTMDGIHLGQEAYRVMHDMLENAVAALAQG